ncbi:prepilin peptidase [Azospirillum griseum]|uniref:Prepilin peptidase n=1 Tax=Azospirillum griseum TaxID=2496639 RepID=A0A3S0HW25_9PROT|nr:A24 family peptidase [Azospirillum griseum]RTR18132.1 prepilin peptidase [Azospirillum griseum]
MTDDAFSIPLILLCVLAALPVGRVIGAMAAALPDRAWPLGEGWRARPRPLATLGAGAVAGMAALSAPWPLTPVACLFGWALLLAALVDARCRLLPDVVTLPLLPLGLAVTGWTAPDGDWSGPVIAHALAALLGYALFAGLAAAYRRLRGRDGLGLGDAKLLAVAGAWVGVEGLPSVVLLAAVSALAVTLARAALRGDRLSGGASIAFGPYLAVVLWLIWLVGSLR